MEFIMEQGDKPDLRFRNMLRFNGSSWVISIPKPLFDNWKFINHKIIDKKMAVEVTVRFLFGDDGKKVSEESLNLEV